MSRPWSLKKELFLFWLLFALSVLFFWFFIRQPVLDNEVYLSFPWNLDKSQAEKALDFWYSTGVFLFVVLFFFFLFLLLYQKLNQRPLKNLIRQAETYNSKGIFLPLNLPKDSVYSSLSQTLNQMVGKLEERIDTINSQKMELEAILGGMEEGVIVLDTQLKIIRWNEAFCGFFYPRDLFGMPLGEIIPSTRLLDFIHGILAKDKTQDFELSLKGNQEKIFHITGTPLKTPLTPFSRGVILVFQDITAITRLEKIRKDFVANVSHELKTPITSIKGYVETLLEYSKKDGSTEKVFLEKIHKNANRLDFIINDLLALSRLEESGTWTKEREKIALSELCHGIASNLEDDALEKGVKISVKGQKDCYFFGYPSLLEQAISNLVSNSIKYANEGKKVEIKWIKTGECIKISVKDWGKGILLEEQKRIFERFYRLDKARSRMQGGTGLGLSIVKHIALAHGGEIKLVSTPNKGSTFTLILPLVSPPDDV